MKGWKLVSLIPAALIGIIITQILIWIAESLIFIIKIFVIKPAAILNNSVLEYWKELWIYSEKIKKRM